MFVYEITPSGDVATCKQKESIPSGVVFLADAVLPDKAYRSAWRIVAGAVVITDPPKSDIDRAIAKTARVDEISTLTVTHAGNTYDADEAGFAAIAKAVTFGIAGETIDWKMADNSIVNVPWEDLKAVGRKIGFIYTSLIAV